MHGQNTTPKTLTRLVVLASALSAALTPNERGRVLLQVLPAHDFAPSDGRQMDVPAWRIDRDIAAKVIAAFDARIGGQPLVIDYEHQTLHKEKNGQPAPAAGWIHGFRWDEARGLFAEVELTERARQLIAAGEYRYFSPVLEYHTKTGDVTQILMGALTNAPAIHGMQAANLMAAASARFAAGANLSHESLNQEQHMDLLKKLLTALGLPEDATEDQALERVGAVMADSQAARDALELGDEALPEALSAAVKAIKDKAVAAASAQQPDPAKYVPVAVVQELQANVAALTAKQTEREADDLIAPALADGRLLPVEEAWARSLVQSTGGVDALSQLLQVRQPIAALTGTQTDGQPPKAPTAHGLTESELAVAAACGITPEAYAAAKPQVA